MCSPVAVAHNRRQNLEARDGGGERRTPNNKNINEIQVFTASFSYYRGVMDSK